MPIKPLWAPWRMEYLRSQEKPSGCIFCEFPKDDDDPGNLIVSRKKNVFVILNKFPYNNGHLMVVPYKHTSQLDELTSDTTLEMMAVMQQSIQALKAVYKPEGFNIGMNVGRAGGAGIAEHLHLHVVPRWSGDTNFLPIMSEVKAMPQHLSSTYSDLHSFFEKDGTP